MQKIQKQLGFIAGYIIAGISLIAITMTGLAFMSQDYGGKKLVYDTAKTMRQQISTIHAAVSNCSLLHPSGDNGTSHHRAYPAGTNADIMGLDCPGAPYTNKNLWTGRDGMTPPLAPKATNGWKYTNDATGVYITISSDDGSIQQAFSNVDEKYVSTQVEISGDTFKYWVLKE